MTSIATFLESLQDEINSYAIQLGTTFAQEHERLTHRLDGSGPPSMVLPPAGDRVKNWDPMFDLERAILQLAWAAARLAALGPEGALVAAAHAARATERLALFQAVQNDFHLWDDPVSKQNASNAKGKRTKRDPARAMLAALLAGKDKPAGGWESYAHAAEVLAPKLRVHYGREIAVDMPAAVRKWIKNGIVDGKPVDRVGEAYLANAAPPKP
jgi:hypothetical protein